MKKWNNSELFFTRSRAKRCWMFSGVALRALKQSLTHQQPVAVVVVVAIVMENLLTWNSRNGEKKSPLIYFISFVYLTFNNLLQDAFSTNSRAYERRLNTCSAFYIFHMYAGMGEWRRTFVESIRLSEIDYITSRRLFRRRQLNGLLL